MSFAVWLTGLPASGKSAIARELLRLLHARGLEPAVLESDVLRTQLTPHARYDEGERDLFYAALVELGFAEVFVVTPAAVCAARDPKGLYRAAREGRAAMLPGVQAAYEPPERPELVVRGDAATPEEGARAIVALLERRGWL
jgi:adenylylsulfate kinase-like enzyme